MNLQEIEEAMQQCVAYMFASGRTALEQGEQLVPVAHFFRLDGKSEILSIPDIPRTEEAKENVANYLRHKLATGLYVGLLLRFDSVLTRLTELPKSTIVKQTSNAITISYQTYTDSTMYVLSYAEVTRGRSKKLHFKDIEKMEAMPGGRFSKLFPEPNLIH